METTLKDLCFQLLLQLSLVLGVLSTCVFPPYLQSGVHNGELLPWKTHTWWVNLRKEPRWNQRVEVYVKQTTMWFQQEVENVPCEKKTRRVTNEQTTRSKCVTRSLLFNVTCLIQDGSAKYRVLQYTPGGPDVYQCLKFARRSDSVLQVLRGPVSDRNEKNLCDDKNFTLDKWPWIGTWETQTAQCPLAGGFSFRTLSRLTNQDLCAGEWRSSRLEIECLGGDGIDFIAPRGSQCNPFHSNDDYTKLHCWAGWEDGQYYYMVASVADMDPQYCLRFPKYHKETFVALVYFSVICPTEMDGQPPTGVDYYELHLKQIDSQTCEDDNTDECIKLAQGEGICETNENKFTPHCRKTCRLCEEENLGPARCSFGELSKGGWMLYDRNRIEEVQINETSIRFSHFGTFHCYQPTMDQRKFKAISTFANGCSARYTCIELFRQNNNILRYRLGPSLRQDEEFKEICHFREDPRPLMDTYRSSTMKNLILAGRLWDVYCGLQGTIPFNGTYLGEKCDGTISDWSEDTCTLRGTIRLRASNCRALYEPREYQCLLFIEDKVGLFDNLLLTRSLDGRHEYNCWVLSQLPVPPGSRPRRTMYQMPTPQCSSLSAVLVHVDRYPRSVLELTGGHDNRKCLRQEPITPPPRESLSNDTVTSQEEAEEHETYGVIPPNPNEDDSFGTQDVRISNVPVYQPYGGATIATGCHGTVTVLTLVAMCLGLLR